MPELTKLQGRISVTTSAEEQELRDRLSLIESMIAEGRRTTQSWGWIFVFWGVAYYFCIAGSVWMDHSSPVRNWTIGAIQILFFLIAAWRINASYQKRSKEISRPMSTLDRALFSIWGAAGISMAILIVSLGVGGRSNSNLVVAIIGTLLGAASAASSMILKWKLQFACALVWWAMAVISCIGTTRQSFVGLLVANFFCQIVFGIYGMAREAGARRQEAIHA
jgi:hypothetical protein